MTKKNTGNLENLDFPEMIKEMAQQDRMLGNESERICDHCGYPTHYSASFMLEDDVWLEANQGRLEGFMHIDCVEMALGRPLTIDDFKSAPINLTFFIGFRMGVEKVLQEVSKQGVIIEEKEIN